MYDKKLNNQLIEVFSEKHNSSVLVVLWNIHNIKKVMEDFIEYIELDEHKFAFKSFNEKTLVDKKDNIYYFISFSSLKYSMGLMPTHVFVDKEVDGFLQKSFYLMTLMHRCKI